MTESSSCKRIANFQPSGKASSTGRRQRSIFTVTATQTEEQHLENPPTSLMAKDIAKQLLDALAVQRNSVQNPSYKRKLDEFLEVDDTKVDSRPSKKFKTKKSWLFTHPRTFSFVKQTKNSRISSYRKKFSLRKNIEKKNGKVLSKSGLKFIKSTLKHKDVKNVYCFNSVSRVNKTIFNRNNLKENKIEKMDEN